MPQQMPTTPETKAHMLQLINTLETDPFNKNAKENAREVLLWLTNAPDVTVQLCGGVMGELSKFKGGEGSTLVGQLIFSEAKFILENPDKANDQQAINVSGVEGVIRTYNAMKQAKPKLKIEPMEKLLQLQSEHKLEAFIEEALKKCK